jgi:hypothetical protein
MKTFVEWVQEKHDLDEAWWSDIRQFGRAGWWALRNSDAQTQQNFQKLVAQRQQQFPNKQPQAIAQETMQELLQLVQSGTKTDFADAVNSQLGGKTMSTGALFR